LEILDMKKSLLALAVLSAFAGAVSAQSSVTLSGGVDLGVVRQNGSWNMQTAGSGRSALNFSGNEDLGGGMRAFFNLNHRFQPNNGTQTDAARFWRQAWVGLGGGFGEVRLGRFLPPLQTYNGDFDPFGTDTVGSTHTGGIDAGSGGNARNNNQIEYISPTFGGVSLRASIAAGDENGNIERPIGFGVNFGAGPFRVSAAYDRNGVDQKTLGVYGSFNAGFATFMAQFEKGNDHVIYEPGLAATPANIAFLGDVKRWSIGARVPLGAATLKAGFTKWGDEEVKKIGVGLDYALSKRTNLYTDVGKFSGDGAEFALSGRTAAAAVTQSNATKTRFDVGIFHKF
jgi:predicted porin